MRSSLSALFALLLSFLPHQANASTPFWGEHQRLLYIAETGLTGSFGPLSLCAQVTDRYVFFLPILRDTGPYVLSDHFCAMGDVSQIPQDRIPMFQASGIIPEDLPLTPDVPIVWSASVKRLIGFLALVALAAPVIFAQRRRASGGRKTQLSGDPVYFEVLATVMFHTARTDGALAKEDFDVLRGVFKKLTGMPMASSLMASKQAEVLPEDTVLKLAKQYHGKEAEVLIDAAFHVAKRDGQVSGSRESFLKNLNGVLQRTPSTQAAP